MDWNTVTLGSASLRGQNRPPYFTPADDQRLQRARAELADPAFGRRILVLDPERLRGEMSADLLLNILAQHKAATGATRAFVVIDYLGLVRVPERLDELEADRHRVQFVRKLTDATKTARNPAGDCVLAISELRKPSGHSAWAGKLADLMGSARLPYAVDAAFTFRRPETRDRETLHDYDWSIVDVNSPSPEALEEARIAPIFLDIVKGRDGFQLGSIAFAFLYEQSRLVPLDRVHHTSTIVAPFVSRQAAITRRPGLPDPLPRA